MFSIFKLIKGIQIMKPESKIQIGAVFVEKQKINNPEIYEVIAYTPSRICVTRVEPSILSIQVDTLVKALNFDFETINLVLEPLFIAKYKPGWRETRKGCLWFSREDFEFSFKATKCNRYNNKF